VPTVSRTSGLVVLSCLFLVAALAAPSPAADRRTPVVVAVEKVAPAVVNISTERVASRQFAPFPRDPDMDEFFRRFFPPRSQKAHSLGSGALIDPDGFVVTNHHVVADASRIQVTRVAEDGKERSYEARLVNSDPQNDLALLKIEGGPFPYVEIAEVDDLMIGETVIAVGNPIGLGLTVTTGVLSAKDRRLALSPTVKFENLLQTDASINPGNSGGPLLDINGRLIGVNIAIVRFVRGQNIQGIGFAIPAGRVRDVLDDLLDYEKLNRVWLGFEPEQAPGGVAAVLVKEVEKDGPAGRAGLRDGDFIVELDGRPVRSLFGFKKRILRQRKGDRVTLGVRRDGEVIRAVIEVAEIPVPEVVRLAWERLGAVIVLPGPKSPLDRFIGVVGVRPDGPADRIGIQKGDVIYELAGKAVDGPRQLVEVLRDAPVGRPIAIRIYRPVQDRKMVGRVKLD
jgi:serine protease Do